MILSITLNPSVDRTVFLDGLKVHDTNRIARTETDAGGKGVNLSRVAHELGAATTSLAFAGGGSGAYIERVLQSDGVPCRFVPVQGETRINISIEDGSGQPPTTLNEKGPTIHPEEWEKLRLIAVELGRKASWTTMGGSIPPGLGAESYRELAMLLRPLGTRLCIDCDGEAMKHALSIVPDAIKPNRQEAERLLGRKIAKRDDALGAADEWHRQGVGYAMVSLGAEGAVLACAEGRFVGTPPRLESKSTIGSGDSLLGAFFAMLERGAPAADALRWGMAAGAATALTDGSDIGRRDVIESLVKAVEIRRC